MGLERHKNRRINKIKKSNHNGCSFLFCITFTESTKSLNDKVYKNKQLGGW